MVKYELTLRREGKPVTSFAMGGRPLLIGRSPDADVVLADRQISRQHARLSFKNGELIIKDLGSTNGLVVNGERVKSIALREGDAVELGDYTLQVHALTDKALEHEQGLQIPFEAATKIYQRLVQLDSREPLPTLYKAAQLLGHRSDLQKLLREVLALAVEAVPGRRGFILTRFPDEEDFQIRASTIPEGEESSRFLSRTLVNYVLTTKNAVLTANAQMDPRFQHTDSIVRLGVEAVICVPLYGSEGVLGAIYVDSDAKPAAFTTDHLHLLTALGRVVGVAVENARLHEEKVERERFATLGEAVAGITHCMKNLLTGITASEELMESAREGSNWDRMDRALVIMRKSVSQFEKLARDLLTYARKTDLCCSLNAPGALVRDAVEAVQAYAQKYGVKLVFEEQSLETVSLDRDQMFRVLLNLLHNAIEACDGAGGQVGVSCWQDRGYTYIEVSDTGVGIAAEHLPKLFHPFFTTKGRQGTGLGLACSARIVEQHGGAITVDSEAGKGSTFLVALPRASADQPSTDKMAAVGS